MLELFMLASGAGVGFLSGLLGIGGGIVMFPLLVYLPPLLGLDPIDVKSATGLTMAQGFFASFSAMLFYNRHNLVSRPLVLCMGLALFASSLTGSLLSARVPDRALLASFAVLAAVAAALMFMPRSHARDESTSEAVSFNRPLAIAMSIPLGLMLGMLGQGGAFIIIPLMLYVLKVPLRVAMGSMLAIGLFSASAGMAGKLVTGQVPFTLTAFMLLGAIPAAQIGGRVSKKTDARVLRWILAAVILAAAVKVCIDVLPATS